MLTNKKVLSAKLTQTIIKKAEKLGFTKAEKDYGDYAFLYFNKRKEIKGCSGFRYFNSLEHFEEVSPEWILALEEPKPTPSLKDLMPISGFYVDREGKIRELKDHTQHYTSELWNVLPTKEEAEAYKVLPFLLQWRDKYNEGWKPDWKSNIVKYVIYFDCDKIYADITYYETCLFSFECEEIRDKFLEDFREELEIVKPLL